MTTFRTFSRILLVLVGSILAVIFLAALPQVIQSSETGLHLNLAGFWHTAVVYLSGLLDGSSFDIKRGWFGESSPFLPAAFRAFRTSLPYASVACGVALVLSLALGLTLGGTRREHLQDLLGGMGAIPDFILVLLLQIAVVAIYKATGWHISRVATIASDEQAILLPLLVLCVIPTAFLLKGTSNTVRQVLAQEFIMTARAQGLSRPQVLRRHVLPHALLHVNASSARLAALVVGNLFIVEYLFNIPGLGRLVFSSAFWRGYQPNVVINCLLLVVVVFGLLWAGIRVVTALLRATVTRN